ncbi:MAG: YicC/YloC family endoribonuclease, partial [Pseudomonadota bacterium]
MTGFASLQGARDGATWTWEIRSVNARGMDLKLRLPDGFEKAEVALRKALAGRVARGTISCTLRVVQGAAAQGLSVNGEVLERMLAALQTVTARAAARGIEMPAGTASEVLTLRGVLDGAGEAAEPVWAEVALGQIGELVETFTAARTSEGAAIQDILTRALADVAQTVGDARTLLDARAAEQRAALTAKIARVLEDADGVDPARLEQELALLAIRSDITEELDRLDTHIT